jgi:hypothetical protein
MIQSEVIQQVYSLRAHLGLGTAFTVRVDHKQYLVTAKHVLNGDRDLLIPRTSHIELFRAGIWHRVDYELVCVTEDPGDIAVLALSQALLSFPEVELGTKGLVYGQEVFFLGFPYEWRKDVGPLNNGFPLPYVKRAIVSMLNFDPDPIIVLDGINNAGFSGGPVAFMNKAGQWQIAAVISGFNSVREPVVNAYTDEPSDFSVDQNTGLIDATCLDSVLELIRANPIGRQL